ncbi:multidrug abc transporter atp-binding protein [Leptolyngbya sp. Heron Island J]|uniref:ABC transporter ATP-binding protein n=1 Tax=Leptolyngbya sp. Heron Island J TaxID=1385935 RepID=UPI0003B9F4DD|nr:ABC transporter ATP-binding protein [Leptolyngbya sp. Heron Island J]ESA32622.1 multidrug abc transporter atp-binding protein [Leptolyngbya sp. Heron Island J]
MDTVFPTDANPAAIVHRPVIVKIQELSKSYRTGFWLNQQVVSLQPCSLEVYQGETFGLLGPNGAGKTTLLKLLLGIIRPSSGNAQLLNRPAGDQTIKQQIGYLPENPYFYDYLTGWEFLTYSAGLFNIPASIYKERIPELLDIVGLSRQTAIKKQLRQYSKGMLQRIGMAQALINDPDIIFLDEPMSGLDPTGRYQVREVILSLKDQGKTIFFNSHILADVEVICDRIAILDQGALICQGSLHELLGSPDAYFVKGQGGSLDVLKKWLQNLTFEGGYWQGYLHGSPSDFMASINLMNGRLITLDLRRLSLEDFFIQQIHQRRTNPNPN